MAKGYGYTDPQVRGVLAGSVNATAGSTSSQMEQSVTEALKAGTDELTITAGDP